MYEVDDKSWPIVVVTWQGDATDEDIEQMCRDVDRWLSRNERFGLLLDTRAAKGTMNGRQRERLIGHMKANADRSGRLMVQAIVHDHPLHRALYAAISLLFPLPFPSKTFPEPDSARTWLSDKLSSVRAA